MPRWPDPTTAVDRLPVPPCRNPARTSILRSWRPAEPTRAVDLDDITAALLTEAGRFGVELDRGCVEEVVELLDASDAEFEQLLHSLDALATSSSSAPADNTAPSSRPTEAIRERITGFLVWNTPSPIDVDALRISLIECVAAKADPVLVAEAAPALAGVDGVYPLECVEQVLITFDDQTLKCCRLTRRRRCPPGSRTAWSPTSSSSRSAAHTHPTPRRSTRSELARFARSGAAGCGRRPAGSDDRTPIRVASVRGLTRAGGSEEPLWHGSTLGSDE